MENADELNQINQNDADVLLLMRTTAQAEKGNRHYISNNNQYTKWVDNHVQPTQLGLEDGQYFSATALNTYFIKVVSTWDMQVASARKHMNAMNQQLRKDGNNSLFGAHPPMNTKSLSIENGPCSVAIKAALAQVATNNRRKVQNADECAHTHLPTNIISQEDISRMCQNRISMPHGSWQKTAATLSACSISLMRFENARKMTIDKLKVLTNCPPHGIETPHDTRSWESTKIMASADGNVLGMIIPKNDQIKKNKKIENIRNEVTGGYRHKRYERCYHAICAFSILEIMHFRNINVSFLAKENVPEGSVHWRSLKIFHEEYQSARTSFIATRADADVQKWEKETHFR